MVEIVFFHIQFENYNQKFHLEEARSIVHFLSSSFHSISVESTIDEGFFFVKFLHFIYVTIKRKINSMVLFIVYE